MFKVAPCDPCEWGEILRESKDGEMISVPNKCVDCDYQKCNCELTEVAA